METLPRHNAIWHVVLNIVGLFKLRIGFVIMITALAGYAVTPGKAIGSIQLAILALAVMISSASAGAFNQYLEWDIDRLMQRTQGRAFVTGELSHTPAWLLLIGVLQAFSVLAVWQASNALAAFYVFLGAFFYVVIYTVWLKRRSWLNIVIGGLAGSFSVLAGAAAANLTIGAVPLQLALVLFLWTPPHFWSLAIAYKDDYATAGIPMLPVVIGEARAARVVFFSALLLVAASLLPAWSGCGVIYLGGAVAGGGYFLVKAWQLAQNPSKKTAMSSFFASLLQISLLLLATILDAWQH
ncbi:MAG: heme o synthase [Sterolibacterium sp.]|nr:heme o synthase [Sterolibacterium sp.]